MAKYVIEFEKLYLVCGCKEEEQKMAKFLFGMNKPIANLAELQTYNTFDELCQLTSKVERQQNEAKGRSSRLSFTPKTETSFSFVKAETLDKGKSGSNLVKGEASQEFQRGEKDEIKCWGTTIRLS